MGRKAYYSEVIKLFEAKGYKIQITEEQYKITKTEKIPSLCPGNHGLIFVNLAELKRGGSCCKECGKEKSKQTFMKNYGVDNPNKNPEVREKTKRTNRIKYGADYGLQNKEIREKIKQTTMMIHGVEYVSQSEVVKAKVKQTNLLRYGVEMPSQNPDVIQKMRETNIIRYGVEIVSQNPEIRERAKQTNLIKYGHESPLQNEEVKEKVRETNRKNFGVDYPMQNAEIRAERNKKSFKLKPYLFPSGREILIQGYEHFSLDELLNGGYNENEIYTDHNERIKMPEVWYNFEEKTRRYYPDIFIPKDNLIIEVKSRYTYDKQKEKNLAKAEKCKELGYSYEFRIYDKKGKLERKIIYKSNSLILNILYS